MQSTRFAWRFLWPNKPSHNIRTKDREFCVCFFSQEGRMKLTLPKNKDEILCDSFKNKNPHLLCSSCAWHCAKHLIRFNILNPYKNSVSYILWLCLFYRWGSWDSERLSNSPRVTQPGSVGAGIWSRVYWILYTHPTHRHTHTHTHTVP